MSALESTANRCLSMFSHRVVVVSQDSMMPHALPLPSRHQDQLSQELRLLLLLLLAIPILFVGCSTSRHTVAGSGPASAIGSQSVGAIAVDDDSGVSRTNDPSPVRPVAHQTDEKGVGDDTTDNAVQLAIPLEQEVIPVPCATELEDGLTLEAIELMALANNPAIKQASAASARAGGIRTQVGLKPNPTVGYFADEIGDNGAAGLHGAFLSQTIVRGDKLAWNRRVVGHDVNAMNWLVETQRQRLRTDIRLVFYEALAAQKRLDLSREFRIVAKRGVTVSEEQMKADFGTKPDVLQSEIQLNEVDLAIQQAEFEYLAAWKELEALAGVPDLSQSTLIGDLNVADVTRNEENEFAQIVATSPLLAAAQSRVSRARCNLQRQRVQPISNVTAQLGVGHDDSTGDEFANVQLSLPVPVHNKNQGNIRAAYAEYCAATQNVDRIRVSIRRDLARVMREYQVSEATVLQYEQKILPKSKETLELIQQAQDAGEFDFLRVLTARRAYFDANIKYVVALGQLAQANAKIDGLLLTGGLSNVASYDGDDSLRGQALNGQ